MLTLEQITDIADQVLRSTLGGSGYDKVEVRTGLDHEGEPSLFLTAHFKPAAGVTNAKLALDARVALWTALRERNDERFPYIRFVYPDDLSPVDDGDHEEAAEE